MAKELKENLMKIASGSMTVKKKAGWEIIEKFNN